MSTAEFKIQPNDRLAEQIVLGLMLASTSAAAQGLSLLVGSDFYHPAHAAIFETVATLHEESVLIEAGTVHNRLLINGVAARVGGAPYLMELLATSATPGSLTYFAGQVAELAQRRALADAGTRIAQHAVANGTETADGLTDWAAEQIAAVRAGTGDANPDDALSADDLLAEPAAADWVVPGLLERGDRLILTGGEGGGKSTLIRQIGVSAAAGLQPFTQRRLPPPCRVMVVDAENGRALTMRRYAPLLQAARATGALGAFALHLHPGGLDLCQRAGAGWLLRRVERHRPDLLLIGPLYRLHIGDPSDERDARRVAAVLDRARECHGAAVVLEAHSPHQAANTRVRNVRPVGSSLWLRWPEFGYGLRTSAEEHAAHFRLTDFVAWRGPRDERRWPTRLRAGTNGWPWIVDEEGGSR